MLTKNVCFDLIPDVKNICDQYFGELNLHFFGHINVQLDGKYHILNSSRDWPEYGLQQEFPPAGFITYDKLENGIVLPCMDSGAALGWSDAVMASAKEQFGITNLMGIFKKYEDHYQAFFFDLHEKNALEKYLNHFDFFENFILYFREKSMRLAKIAQKDPLQVKSKYLEMQQSQLINFKNKDHYNKLLPSQYYLRHCNKEFAITRREYQCLDHLAHGKKIKEIARLLDISARTVESHLISLKQKIGIDNLSEAIDIYWKNRLLTTTE